MSIAPVFKQIASGTGHVGKGTKIIAGPLDCIKGPTGTVNSGHI